jgi:Tol biopolymer transport system component
MKKQRATITIIVLCSIFFMLLGSQLATAEGGKIVFSKLIGDKWQIVVTDENGQNLQNLSKNGANDNEPSWSFDGKYIAFVSDRNGTLNVYIMDADGSNQHLLTKKNKDVWEHCPSFSPDGKNLFLQEKLVGICHKSNLIPKFIP